jgi:hypothetical protein
MRTGATKGLELLDNEASNCPKIGKERQENEVSNYQKMSLETSRQPENTARNLKDNKARNFSQ